MFSAEGPQAVKTLAGLGFEIFLDLKFHDIPNTVAGAVAAAAALPRVRLINVHALGGLEMMRAARDAVSGMRKPPALLGVTILTSMDAPELRRVGIPGTPAKRAVELARLAKQAGLDGVVASGNEALAIRRACGSILDLGEISFKSSWRRIYIPLYLRRSCLARHFLEEKASYVKTRLSKSGLMSVLLLRCVQGLEQH